MDLSMFTIEVIATIITAVLITMCTTVAVLRQGTSTKTYKSQEQPPPKEHSSNDILEAPTGWADRTFVAKYEEGCHKPNSLSGDAPSQCAQLIRQRRSIFPKDFVFDGSQVNIEYIEEALAAANWAPTHGKTEPWRFVVIGPNTLQKVLDIREEFMTELLTKKGDEKGLEKLRSKIAKKRKELQSCSAVIFIIVKRVPKSKGGYMPEWEEVAAVSCAVQNLHIQLTSRWADGIGGYWSSGGENTWLQAPALCELLGARDGSEGDTPGRDLVLGGFYMGVCPPEKMDKYRSARGKIADKVKWLY